MTKYELDYFPEDIKIDDTYLVKLEEYEDNIYKNIDIKESIMRNVLFITSNSFGSTLGLFLLQSEVSLTLVFFIGSSIGCVPILYDFYDVDIDFNDGLKIDNIQCLIFGSVKIFISGVINYSIIQPKKELYEITNKSIKEIEIEIQKHDNPIAFHIPGYVKHLGIVSMFFVIIVILLRR